MLHGKRDESGKLDANLLIVLVLVVVVAAAALLQRTAATAEAINRKATSIAQTGRGINDNTDSVLQLTSTNKYATSILGSAQPLQGKLATVVNLAQSIEGLATSINNSAGTIHGTAGQINSTAGSINSSALAINSTAGGINSTAAQVLAVAQDINVGVGMINTNLDGTIAVANTIKGDTASIVNLATTARKEAACIDQGLGGNAAGQC